MAEFPHASGRAAAAVAVLDQFSAVSTIFDAAEIVLYVADIDTHELLFLNAQAERLWGPNSVGRRCYEILQSRQAGPCAFCTNDRLVEGGRPRPPVVWEFQNTLNGRWYLCVDKAIPWTDGRLVRMEVAIDVTDRKASEEFREQYVGLISHDLRSPLAGIASWASGLKLLFDKQDVSVANASKAVDGILKNTRRMQEMIEDLLDTTRLESGKLTLRRSPLNLSELAAAVSSRLSAETSRAIRFEGDTEAAVLADPERLERVLENLLGNAIRYSPAGAPVTVRVATHETEVVVTVSDCGLGIPEDEHSKLFQRFYRASTAHAIGGLGLGLYNSRLIVESHGGRIWAESQPGAGSTFGFAVPVAALA